MAVTGHNHQTLATKTGRPGWEEGELPSNNEGRLTDIIRTFREHNRRLMERMVQCERQREQETSFYKRKQSLKVMRGIVDNQRQPASTNTVHYHTIKTDRERFPLAVTKQNLVGACLEDGQRAGECSSPQERVVKVNFNKLVPLTLEAIKQRRQLQRMHSD